MSVQVAGCAPIIRHKHDLRQKLHIPLSIEYRGKADSANVLCSCGYVDLIAVWFTGDKLANTRGFGTAKAWQDLVDGITKYLESIHPIPPIDE